MTGRLVNTLVLFQNNKCIEGTGFSFKDQRGTTVSVQMCNYEHIFLFEMHSVCLTPSEAWLWQSMSVSLNGPSALLQTLARFHASTVRPQEMSELIPSDQQHLSARMERRDRLLMALAKLKKEHEGQQH